MRTRKLEGAAGPPPVTLSNGVTVLPGPMARLAWRQGYGPSFCKVIAALEAGGCEPRPVDPDDPNPPAARARSRGGAR
jgi:hypothetical protein